MKTLKKYEGEKTVIALGYYDSVHLGHVFIINNAIRLARENGAKCAVFTFSSSPYSLIKGDRKEILTFSERVERLFSLGVDDVIYVEPSVDFFNIDAEDYLRTLSDKFNVVGFVSGEDYRFGKEARGDAVMLKDFASKNGVIYESFPLLEMDGVKVGTGEISKLLNEGKVDVANCRLGYDYFLTGEIIHGRGDGKRSVVPTVNIDYPDLKCEVKDGVYTTLTEIDGKAYCSLTNVGTHPTFGDYKRNVETYLLDFSGDVYGKTAKINFKKYVREIVKFESCEALKEQIAKDVKFTREVYERD